MPPRFTPHDMSAHEFNEWAKTIEDEDCALLLTFVTYLVLAENYPPVTIPELRGFIHAVYTNRPNKTWDGFLEYIKVTEHDEHE